MLGCLLNADMFLLLIFMQNEKVCLVPGLNVNQEKKI